MMSKPSFLKKNKLCIAFIIVFSVLNIQSFAQDKYQYSKKGRLLGNNTKQFTYDKLGNRLTFNKTSSSESQSIDIVASQNSQTANSFPKGSQLNLSLSVQNNSEGIANNTFSEVYWSRQNKIDENSLSLTTDFQYSIEANQTVQRELSVILPDTLSDGQGYLILKVDSKDLIEETNEENNLVVIPITIDNSLIPERTIEANFQASLQYICPGSTVFFADLSQGEPTTWNWEFEGGLPASSTEQNPRVVYDQPGTYKVSLTAKDGDVEGTKEQVSYVVVEGENTNNSTTVSIETDGALAICEQGTVTLKAPDGFTGYFWSNGESAKQIDVNQPGEYYLSVKKCNGEIIESEPVIVTREDFSVSVASLNPATCNADGEVSLNISGITNFEVEWSNGETGTSLTNLESGYYEATVKSESGCEQTIGVSVTRVQAPTFTMQPVQTSCGEANGSIALNLDNPENFSFEWSNGNTSSSVDGLASGSYWVKVNNTETGCTTTKSIFIETSENNIPDFDAGEDQMVDEDQETLELPQLTDLGSWSIGGASTGKLELDANSGKWIFYPKESGAGEFELIYTATNDQSCTRSDSFLLTVNQVTALENEVLLRTGIKLFPNPSDTELYIQKEAAGTEVLRSIDLLDDLGRSLKSKQYDQVLFEDTWNVSSYPSGLYFLAITTDKGVYKLKVLIRH
jgi:PKD repeat protein